MGVKAMQKSPNPMAPGVAVGITETMIEALVSHFYARVRRDEMLGPIFNKAIDDWPEHLHKLSAFWSSVTLMSGKYKGQPMVVHTGIPEITGAHFARWLELFKSSAEVICPPAAAALFVDRSERIAQSLQLGIAMHRGESVVPPLRAPLEPACQQPEPQDQ